MAQQDIKTSGQQAPGLRRELKARHLTMIAIGGSIGTGLFVASGATFQIWHPDAWAEEEAKLRDWLDEQPEDFDPLSLLPDEDEVE